MFSFLSPLLQLFKYNEGVLVKDPDEIRTAVLFLWLLAEPVRLWTGYSGNLRENVSKPFSSSLSPLSLSSFLRLKPPRFFHLVFVGSYLACLLAHHVLRELSCVDILFFCPEGHRTLRQGHQRDGLSLPTLRAHGWSLCCKFESAFFPLSPSFASLD